MCLPDNQPTFLKVCSFVWSVGLLVGLLVGWLVGRAVGRSIGRLVGRSVYWSVYWLVGRSVGLLVGLLVGWSVGRVRFPLAICTLLCCYVAMNWYLASSGCKTGSPQSLQGKLVRPAYIENLPGQMTGRLLIPDDSLGILVGPNDRDFLRTGCA